MDALLEKLGLRAPDSIWYIGGSDVLPEPLDSEEERRCLAAYAAGSDEARSVAPACVTSRA